jgi:rhodanese-related sulfurtransferase
MKHLSPRDAYAYLSATPDAVFIDCRSEAEYFLVGHPVVEHAGAEPTRPHHIWWADELRLEMNERFVEDVAQVAGARERPVVLICRSGRRSVSAAEALEAAGWTEVYNVLEGFEGPLDDRDRRSTLGGWRVAGLPWEQL